MRSVLGHIGLDDAMATGAMTPEMVDVFHSLVPRHPHAAQRAGRIARVVLPIKGMNAKLLLDADVLGRIAAPPTSSGAPAIRSATREPARQLAAMIPNAQVEMMPGGHAVWIDDAPYVAKVAESFLAG